VIPRRDWTPVEDTQHGSGWTYYTTGNCLHHNIAVIRVIDSALLRDPLSERGAMTLDRLDAICRRLSPHAPLEHKGRWLAKGAGTSLSTTWDRNDQKFTGLHIDRWERKSLTSYKSARNRVCLNMGPRPRYLVFMTLDLLAIAARYGIDQTASITTSHAQIHLREHPIMPVYRLRIEPGEAYIAPTESLIHDGQASCAAGEWVYTVFGRFDQTDVAQSLSAV